MTTESRPPLQVVRVAQSHTVDDYAAVAHLAPAVAELKLEAQGIVAQLEGRTIWMVSSTAKGGGVAEMLPTVVSLLRGLGIRTEWVVIGSDEPAFFELTKRIHNLIHGVGSPGFSAADRSLYERVNRANAESLRELVRPGDILVIHDPQPLPFARELRPDVPLVAVWRCHIGLDADNAATRAVWNFLEPYFEAYHGAVFSAAEYIPKRLGRRASVVFPGIDPLAPKNRDLSLRRTIEIMCSGGLIPCPGPTVRGPYASLAQRVTANGALAPANVTESIGLLTRPIVTQVSRWDRLKGFGPLMEGFARLKRSLRDGEFNGDPEHRRRLDLARLVLAGPEPASIQDDPEAQGVLEELRASYRALHPAIQDDIALVLLPMGSLEENALMVNALQRASTIVVQNSLREGFGLTIAEAMWKRVPVLTNSRACGPRQQIRDGLDGRLIADPESPAELQLALDQMLADPDRLDRWGQSAQRRVHDQFLVLTQLRAWGRLLSTLLSRGGVSGVDHDSGDTLPS
jgi:trehalose synthase